MHLVHRFKRSLVLAGLLLLCGALPGPALAQACDINWAVDTDGFWDEADNWDLGRAPQYNNHVCIDRPAGAYTVTVRANQNSMASVISAETLRLIDGGVLGSFGISTLSNGLLLEGGYLTGEWQVSGDSIWSGSDLRGTLTNLGTLTIAGGDKAPYRATLTNQGTVIHASGHITASSGTDFFNQAGAAWEIRDGFAYSVRTFDNAGTLGKSGDGDAVFNTTFNNAADGVIDVQSDRLVLNGGGRGDGGTFTVAENAVLEWRNWGGKHTGMFTGSGGGKVQITGNWEAREEGATLDFPEGMLEWVAGTIGGTTCGSAGCSGDTTNAGFLTLVGDADKTLVRSIINTGVIAHSGAGNLTSSRSAYEIANQPGGIYELRSEADILGGTFTNQGTLRKSGGVGESQIGATFNNQGGTIDVQSGTLNLAGYGNSSGGVFNVEAGTVLEFSRDVVSNAQVRMTGVYTGTGAGTVRQRGYLAGIADDPPVLNFPPGMFEWESGNLMWDIVNNGTITLVGDAPKYFRSTFVNNGEFTIAGEGVWQFYVDSTFTNNGLVDFQSDADVEMIGVRCTSCKPTIFNNGTLRKSGGAGVSEVRDPNNYGMLRLDNRKKVEVQHGKFILTGSPTLNGTYSTDAGASVAISGTATVPDGQILSLSPGTTLSFGDNAQLNVEGLLQAVGTTTLPVHFTSNPQTPGTWRGVHVAAGGSATFRHCEVSYAGRDTWAAISVDSSNVQIQQCRIAGNGAAGVVVGNNAQPYLHFNQITGNGFGVRNNTASTLVDARANWWGSDTGPFHDASNPGGQGNGVSDGVLFEPWLTSTVTDLPVLAPRRGGDIGRITLSIFTPTPLFQGAASAKFARAGQPDISIDLSTIHANGLHAQGIADLAGQAQGVWDLVVTPDGGDPVTLPQAFTIEAGIQPNIVMDVLGRETLRVGRPSRFVLTGINTGNVDAAGPIVWVTGLPPDATVKVEPHFVITPAIEGAMAVSPVIQTSTQTVLNLRFPEIPPGVTKHGLFTITVPTAADFEIEVHTVAPSDFRGPATVFAAGMSPAQITPTPENQGIIETWNVMADTPLETSWVTHGLTAPITGKSCESASIQRASNLRARREQPESPLEGWKVGEMYHGSHFVNITQSPHTGDFFLVDNYLHNPFIQRVELANPTETEPALWQFRIPDNAPLFLTDAMLYNHTYNSTRMEEWKPPIASPSGKNGSCPDPNQERRKPVRTVQSMDPNEKQGPVGYGDQRALTGLGQINYAIFFENVITATAPAQEVVVVDALDVNTLDVESFQIGPISFGGVATVVSPPGLQEYHTIVDLRPDQDLLVDIDVRLERVTGVATWHFTSLDPATNELPEDPLAGFLPPNVNAPEGEGYVLFSILPKAGVTSGTEIRNGTTIFFDDNDPLETNVWSNLVDVDAPTSQTESLPPEQPEQFTLRWSGTDVGAGIDRYSIYVSMNDGPFTPWISNTTETSAVFTATVAGTYAFYAIARDGAGNVEAPKQQPEASTYVASVLTETRWLYLPVVVR